MVPGLNSVGSMLLALGLPPGRELEGARMIGLLTDPTFFGLSIMPSLLINLHGVLGSVTKKVKNPIHWSSISMTVLLILGVFLSFSRTTWSGVVAGILILTGLQGQIVRTVFSFFIIVIFLQVVTPDELLETALSANKDRATIELNERNDSRTGIWKAYFRLAVTEPFGYGLGSVEHLRMLPTTFSDAWAAENPRAHNIYLHTWVESGVQTLVPLLLLIGLALVRSWKMRHHVDPSNGMAYGTLACALLVSMTIGLFGLSGMLQMLSITISLGLAIWYLAIEKQLVPMDQMPAQQRKGTPSPSRFTIRNAPLG